MSKHSMRNGASGSSSASCSASSARARALWSDARRSLWRANASFAFSVRGREQLALAAALRDADAHLRTAVQREELLVELVVLGHERDEDLLRARRQRRVGVELLDDAGDERRRFDVLDLVDDQALAADDPALAHVEHLDARFELVLLDAEEVEVLFAARDHLLAFDRLAHARELVADARRELELELRRRRRSSAARAASAPRRARRRGSRAAPATSPSYSSWSIASTHGAAHFSMCA